MRRSRRLRAAGRATRVPAAKMGLNRTVTTSSVFRRGLLYQSEPTQKLFKLEQHSLFLLGKDNCFIRSKLIKAIDFP